jgi:head-tail adaptor
MRPPRLSRALVLEARSTAPDGMGGGAEAWVPLGRLWAEIAPGPGRAVASEFGSRARVGLRITVRAAPDGAPSRPEAGQRLRLGARVFHILAVTEGDPAGRYLTVFAEERAAR